MSMTDYYTFNTYYIILFFIVRSSSSSTRTQRQRQLHYTYIHIHKEEKVSVYIDSFLCDYNN